MTEKKKVLSFDEYLKAKALFAMAQDHYRQSSIYTNALNQMLGFDPPFSCCGHVEDSIFSWPDHRFSFEEAMRLEGFDFETIPPADAIKKADEAERGKA